MSGRALEHKYGVTRRTVAKALRSAWPGSVGLVKVGVDSCPARTGGLLGGLRRPSSAGTDVTDTRASPPHQQRGPRLSSLP
jgi:hypothetical protein